MIDRAGGVLFVFLFEYYVSSKTAHQSRMPATEVKLHTVSGGKEVHGAEALSVHMIGRSLS